RGRFETPPPGIKTPQANGRETYVLAPPDRELNIVDCHFNADSSGSARQQPPGTDYWYNINCDYCDAVKGKAAKHRIVPPTPYEPLVDSVDVTGDGRPDSARFVTDVLLDSETGERHFANDVPPLTDPATGDTLFARGVRTYFDQGCRCNKILANYKVPAYPVG